MNEVSEQKEEIISSLILSLRIFPTVVLINSILKNPNWFDILEDHETLTRSPGCIKYCFLLKLLIIL